MTYDTYQATVQARATALRRDAELRRSVALAAGPRADARKGLRTRFAGVAANLRLRPQAARPACATC